MSSHLHIHVQPDERRHQLALHHGVALEQVAQAAGQLPTRGEPGAQETQQPVRSSPWKQQWNSRTWGMAPHICAFMPLAVSSTKALLQPTARFSDQPPLFTQFNA